MVNHLLNTIPKKVLKSISQNVVRTEIGFHPCGVITSDEPMSFGKALAWIEERAVVNKWSASVTTESGQEISFNRRGFKKLTNSDYDVFSSESEAPFTPVDLVTGIYELDVDLEKYKTRPLYGGVYDSEGCLIQFDSNRVLYRDGQISYRVEKTDKGYVTSFETDVGWFDQEVVYPVEIQAHRAAIWYANGSPLFYKPI